MKSIFISGNNLEETRELSQNVFKLPDFNGVEWLFRSRKRSMILHTLPLEHAPLKTSFQGCHNEFQSFDSNRLY
jgi:hypothetical protein